MTRRGERRGCNTDRTGEMKRGEEREGDRAERGKVRVVCVCARARAPGGGRDAECLAAVDR